MGETYSINELKHWGLSKGQQAEKHKYIARVETGNALNPYRYFYTQEELDAYIAGKKKEQSAIDAGKTVSNTISSALDKFNTFVNSKSDVNPHGDTFMKQQQAMQNIGSDYKTLKNKASDYLDAITARKERANYDQKFEEVFGDSGGKAYDNMNERVKNRSEALERQHSLSSEPNKIYNEKVGAYVDNSTNSMKISEADYKKERRRMDELERAADEYDKANRITTSIKRIIQTHKKYRKKNMKHTDIDITNVMLSDIDLDPEFLEHHGRKGMKWGQHIFGAVKSLGKGTAKLGVRKVGDKVQDKATTRGHKSSSDDVTRDKANDIKNAAIRSGDPRMIAKYSHLMDNKEFSAAISRMGDQQKLNTALAAQNKTIFDKIDKWNKNGQVILDTVDKATSAYDKYKKVKSITNEIKQKTPKTEPKKENPPKTEPQTKPKKEKEVWSGTVEGTGTSRYNGPRRKYKLNNQLALPYRG